MNDITPVFAGAVAGIAISAFAGWESQALTMGAVGAFGGLLYCTGLFEPLLQCLVDLIGGISW